MSEKRNSWARRALLKLGRKTARSSIAKVGEIIGTPMRKFAEKISGFKSTKALGTASPRMLKRLKKEAPEVLRSPNRSEFNSQQAYEEAVRKFEKYGNWASNK